MRQAIHSETAFLKSASSAMVRREAGILEVERFGPASYHSRVRSTGQCDGGTNLGGPEGVGRNR